MERGVKNDTSHPPLRSRNIFKARFTVAFSSGLLVLSDVPVLGGLRFTEITHRANSVHKQIQMFT